MKNIWPYLRGTVKLCISSSLIFSLSAPKRYSIKYDLFGNPNMQFWITVGACFYCHKTGAKIKTKCLNTLTSSSVFCFDISNLNIKISSISSYSLCFLLVFVQVSSNTWINTEDREGSIKLSGWIIFTLLSLYWTWNI